MLRAGPAASRARRDERKYGGIVPSIVAGLSLDRGDASNWLLDQIVAGLPGAFPTTQSARDVFLTAQDTNFLGHLLMTTDAVGLAPELDIRPSLRLGQTAILPVDEGFPVLEIHDVLATPIGRPLSPAARVVIERIARSGAIKLSGLHAFGSAKS